MSISWRKLTIEEIAILENLGNTAEDWNKIKVCDPFKPASVRNNIFCGEVSIGPMCSGYQQNDSIILPVGIVNSRISNCSIGKDVAIADVRYLSGYTIGDSSVLFNIGQMTGSLHDCCFPIELVNENGARASVAFPGITPGDAFLQSRYVADTELTEKFRLFSNFKVHASVAECSHISNCTAINNIVAGPDVKITGATSLDNITIDSTAEAPVLIANGAVLENGIIGRGSSVSSNVIARNFVLSQNCKLGNGARFIHSLLGDNGTISCCEVLNSLIYPSHEQHHNNSFLIASLIMGQSNIAAGATIGSNHNSRTADNELHASRGFWPGLCTSLKHCSHFAPYVLLSKSDYPHELNIPFPFSLVNNNQAENCLEIIPAWWWMYDMYALARNSWKFSSRDRRVSPIQHIETDPFAPDTIEEVLKAMALLEDAAEQQWEKDHPQECANYHESEKMGRRLLLDGKIDIVSFPSAENGRRPVKILKASKAYMAYGQILKHYAVSGLMREPKIIRGEYKSDWTNIGGQIVADDDLLMLLGDIRNGKIASWDEVHGRLDSLWLNYPAQKNLHRYYIVCKLCGADPADGPSESDWRKLCEDAVKLEGEIVQMAILSKAKDDSNPFRRACFNNEEERIAVMGTARENSFIKSLEKEYQVFCTLPWISKL